MLDTDLTGADLTRATIEGASFQAKSLRGANLRGVDLESVDLTGMPLKHAVFDRDTKWAKDFQADAASVYLLQRRAQLPKAELADKVLDFIDLRDSDLRQADLANADLSYSQLKRGRLAGS